MGGFALHHGVTNQRCSLEKALPEPHRLNLYIVHLHLQLLFRVFVLITCLDTLTLVSRLRRVRRRSTALMWVFCVVDIAAAVLRTFAGAAAAFRRGTSVSPYQVLSPVQLDCCRL